MQTYFQTKQEYGNTNEKAIDATKGVKKSYFSSIKVIKYILLLHHHSRKTLKGYYPPCSFNIYCSSSTITDIKFKALTRETSLTIKKSSWGHPCHG